MELPLAPRSPAAVSHRLDDPTHKRNWILGISRCDPASGQRDMGMPPSVAGARLAIAPLQAMKKRPSHRPLAPFPTDCCAKNTQFGRTPVTLLRRRRPQDLLRNINALSGPYQARRGPPTAVMDRLRRPPSTYACLLCRSQSSILLLPSAAGYPVLAAGRFSSPNRAVARRPSARGGVRVPQSARRHP
jgi:hypothetical protein